MSEFKTLPTVAKNIFVECKKCGVERYQKVLTHVGDKKFKAECEVCHSKKTYTIGSPKKKVARKGVKKSGESQEQIWMSLKDKADLSQKKPYNMKGNFEDNQVIEHPKFGLGFVTASNPTAIQVQFEDAARSLVHNRAN